MKKAKKKAPASKKEKEAPAKIPNLSSSTKQVVKVLSSQVVNKEKPRKEKINPVIPSVHALQKERAKEHCNTADPVAVSSTQRAQVVKKEKVTKDKVKIPSVAPDPIDVSSTQRAQVIKMEKTTKEKVKTPSIAALQKEQAKDHCSAPVPVASKCTSKDILGGDKNDVPTLSKSITLTQLKEE